MELDLHETLQVKRVKGTQSRGADESEVEDVIAITESCPGNNDFVTNTGYFRIECERDPIQGGCCCDDVRDDVAYNVDCHSWFVKRVSLWSTQEGHASYR